MDTGVYIDEILESLKWNGRYQILYSIIPYLSYMSVGMASMSVVFIGKMVHHHCKPPQSLNITFGHCTYDVLSNASDVIFNVTYDACSVNVINGTDVIYKTSCPEGYVYNEEHHSSFVSEWDLVCDKESMSDISHTVNYLSEMVWSVLFSRWSDIYGRKKLFMLINTLYFINSLICAFLPNFETYLVLRLLQTGNGMFATVQVIELFPTKHRALSVKITAFVWPTSQLMLCLIAYLTRDLSWRYTQLVIALMSTYILVQWWISDESLRWLCANKKQKEAEELVKKIAKMNKVSPDKALHLLRNSVFEQRDTEKQSEKEEDYINMIYINKPMDSKDNSSVDTKMIEHSPEKKVNLLTIFRSRHFIKIFLILASLWFTDCLTYDGLLMTSSSLAENVYVGFALSVLIDYPSCVAFNLTINRLGRRKCIVVSHVIAGLALIISTIIRMPSLGDEIPSSGWISLGFSIFGRFAISIAYSAVSLVTPEMFPTTIRSTGYAVCTSTAYIAMMIAPHARTVSRHYPWAPSIVFGTLCLIVSPLILILPETTDHELSQTLGDMTKWIGGDKSKRKPPTSL